MLCQAGGGRGRTGSGFFLLSLSISLWVLDQRESLSGKPIDAKRGGGLGVPFQET